MGYSEDKATQMTNSWASLRHQIPDREDTSTAARTTQPDQSISVDSHRADFQADVGPFLTLAEKYDEEIEMCVQNISKQRSHRSKLKLELIAPFATEWCLSSDGRVSLAKCKAAQCFFQRIHSQSSI
jgi:hypothetical protein